MMNPSRSTKATLRLPRSHPQAIWWLTGRHPEATLRLPRGYPEATPRLHASAGRLHPKPRRGEGRMENEEWRGEGRQLCLSPFTGVALGFRGDLGGFGIITIGVCAVDVGQHFGYRC